MAHLIMKFIINFIMMAAVAASSTELVRSFAKKYGTQSHLLVLCSVTNWVLSLIYQDVSYSYYGCSGSCNATKITEWAKERQHPANSNSNRVSIISIQNPIFCNKMLSVTTRQKKCVSTKMTFILCLSSFWMPLQWRRSKVWWRWRKVGRILHYHLLQGKQGNLLWWHVYADILQTDLEWRVDKANVGRFLSIIIQDSAWMSVASKVKIGFLMRWVACLVLPLHKVGAPLIQSIGGFSCRWEIK